MIKKNEKSMVKTEPAHWLFPMEEMDRWFEEAFRGPFPSLRWPRLPRLAEAEGVQASVDIYEAGDNLMIKAELPGMTKDDIEVTFTDDVLTISGEKKREEKVEKKDYYRLERSSGSFRRTFRLPMEVKA
jgi:HSP20 family protein